MSAETHLTEAREEYYSKQDDLLSLVDELGPDMDFSQKKVLERLDAQSADEALEKFRKRNDEVERLGQKVQKLNAELARDQVREREARRRESGEHIHPIDTGGRKTFGRRVVETDDFRRYLKTKTPIEFRMEDVEVKTLFETTAGFAPESVRSGIVVPAATRPIFLTDLIPDFQINQDTFKYMEQTTLTVAAAETAEGGTFNESTIVYSEQTSPVEKITDSIPVTDEQMEDVDQVSSLLDQQLRFNLRQRLDGQTLVGNGTSPNLRGINNVVGIQTRAKGTDHPIAAFAKAMKDIRVTGRAIPNGAVWHPNDWTDVLLTLNNNGDFLFGNPFMGPGPQSLFGVFAVQSDAQTENTVVVGDFANYSRYDLRRGVTVAVGFSGTQFVEGKRTIRADMRIAFTALRPAAFIQLTGM